MQVCKQHVCAVQMQCSVGSSLLQKETLDLIPSEFRKYTVHSATRPKSLNGAENEDHHIAAAAGQCVKNANSDPN